ncbi:hypothetical protein IWQ61_005980 [Dispira simplex]|nr:hypothetical protein IWQ61_005980 [Dispira simplex]
MPQQKNTTLSSSALFRIRDPSVLRSPVPLSNINKHSTRPVTNSLQSPPQRPVTTTDGIHSVLRAPSVLQTTVAPQPQFPFLRSPVPYPTFASPNLKQQRPSSFQGSSFTESISPMNRVRSPPTSVEPTTSRQTSGQTLGMGNMASLKPRTIGAAAQSKNVAPAKVIASKAPKRSHLSESRQGRDWYSNSIQPQRTQNQALPSSLYSLLNSYAQGLRASVAPINHQIQRKNSSLAQTSTGSVVESNSRPGGEKYSPKLPTTSAEALSCKECSTLLVKWWFQPHIYENGQPAVIVKGLRVRTGFPPEEWKSSYIVDRMNDCHVKTITDKVYHLDGPVHEVEMQRAGYSPHVIRGFQDGVPSHWASLLNLKTPTAEKGDLTSDSIDIHRMSQIPDTSSNTIQTSVPMASTTALCGTSVPDFSVSDDSYPLVEDTLYTADLGEDLAMDIVTTRLPSEDIPQAAQNGLLTTKPSPCTITLSPTSPIRDQKGRVAATLESATRLPHTPGKQFTTHRGRNMAKCSRGRSRLPQSAPRHVGNRRPASPVTPQRPSKRPNITPKTISVSSLTSPMPLNSTNNVKVKYVWGGSQAILEVDGQRMTCDALGKLANQEGAMTRSQRRRLFSSLGSVTSFPVTPTPSYGVFIPESPHKRSVTEAKESDNRPAFRSTRKRSPSKGNNKRTTTSLPPPLLPETTTVDCPSLIPETATDETPSLLATGVAKDVGPFRKSTQSSPPSKINLPSATIARVSTRFVKRRTNYTYASSFSPLDAANLEDQEVSLGTYDLSDE